MPNDTEAELLAEEHWNWLESLLRKVYCDASVHGYKHALEDKKVT